VLTFTDACRVQCVESSGGNCSAPHSMCHPPADCLQPLQPSSSALQRHAAAAPGVSQAATVQHFSPAPIPKQQMHTKHMLHCLVLAVHIVSMRKLDAYKARTFSHTKRSPDQQPVLRMLRCRAMPQLHQVPPKLLQCSTSAPKQQMHTKHVVHHQTR
jgi:hypothetical protein